MSNERNTQIQEMVWENVLGLYEQDHNFACDVSNITFNRDHCSADDLSDRDMVTLEYIADEIFDKLGEGLINDSSIIEMAKEYVNPFTYYYN